MRRAVDHEVAAARVVHVHLGLVAVGVGRQRGHGGELHRLEHARVDVGLQPPVGVDGGGVAEDGRAPPAGHVVALGQREDLDPDLLRARRGQERGGDVPVEGGLRVGVVVHDEHTGLLRELDHAVEEALGHDRAGGVVGVVEEQQLRLLGDRGRDGVEVRGEAALGQERERERVGADEQRAARVHRIAGVGGQRDVARVQEGQVEVEDALLGPQGGDDLALLVDLDVEAPCVEVAERLAELGAAAVGRVLVRAGLGDRLLHGVDDHRRRGPVGVADAERDHVDAGRALGGDLALELGEQVRRDPVQAVSGLHAAPR